MENPPSKKELTVICQRLHLLNGSLQDSDHLRTLFASKPRKLQKLWTKVSQIQLDPVPSWETVVAYCGIESDQLKAVADSVSQLTIKLPTELPSLRCAKVAKEKAPARRQEPKLLPAHTIQQLDLDQLRNQVAELRSQRGESEEQVDNEIEEAGEKGVQILCLQEIFNTPYFCPSQDKKWYNVAEKIPEGATTQRMREYAKK